MGKIEMFVNLYC